MATSLEDKDFRRRMQRLEASIEEIEQLPDGATRARIQEIVRTLIDLHGAGLEKILERVAEAGDTGQSMIDDFGQDDLVGGLLLLHGLHPMDLETRVALALEKVRPSLGSHGAAVEIVSIADGLVRLRLEVSRHSCASTASTMKTTIEDAIYEKAPDVAGIEILEMEAAPDVRVNGKHRIGLPMLQKR